MSSPSAINASNTWPRSPGAKESRVVDFDRFVAEDCAIRAIYDAARHCWPSLRRARAPARVTGVTCQWCLA